jgi:hypothetical protein
METDLGEATKQKMFSAASIAFWRWPTPAEDSISGLNKAKYKGNLWNLN